MPNSNIKHILTLALFLVLEFSFAQSAINRLDRYSHAWTTGNECLVLDSGEILLAGIASDTVVQQQSFHLSLHDENGEILNTGFVYDSIYIQSVRSQKNMIQINYDEIFYCYRGFFGDCYYYNLDDYAIHSMNVFGWMEEDSINSAPLVIKSINDTLVISGVIYYDKTNRYDYVITKIKDKELISKTIIELPPYETFPTIGREEIFCLSGNEQYVYIHTDLNGPYLYHVVDDVVRDTITIDPDYQLYSAYMNDDQDIVMSSPIFTDVGDINYKSMVIAKIDLEGNTIWENHLEDEIQKTISTTNGTFYSTSLHTFIDKIIPAVDGNGYIYIGSEHVKEGTDHYSNAIIGKIDEEGSVLWNRKYRYYDTVPGYNEFRDVEPDQYGGYIVYGDIESQDFGLVPYWRRAWLMRVDVDGLLIDTTVSTTNPTLQGYYSFNVSPNPAESSLGLSISLSNVSILDINGRKIMDMEETATDRVDVSGLIEGIYIVLGQGDDGDWYRAKFVKE